MEHIADGSTLCLALAVGMPGGSAKAVADRITAGNLKDLNLYYQHSMNYSEATLIRPEVLSKVNARCFFMGDPDRKMVKLGISEGRKYLSYVPVNFSLVPRVLTEHIHVDTCGHRFADGQIGSFQPGDEQRLRIDGAAPL